jgi:hypothetical protein
VIGATGARAGARYASGMPRVSWALLLSLVGCARLEAPHLPADAYGVVPLPVVEDEREPPPVPFAVVDLFSAYKQARLDAEHEDEVAELFAASLAPWRDILDVHAPELGSEACIEELDERYHEVWRTWHDGRREIPRAYARARGRFPALAFGGTVFVVPGCMDAQGEAGLHSDAIVLSLDAIERSGGSVGTTMVHELFHHHHAERAPGVFDGGTSVHEVVWREGMATWASFAVVPGRPPWRDVSWSELGPLATEARREPRSLRAQRWRDAREAEDLYRLGAALVERSTRQAPVEDLLRLEGAALEAWIAAALDDGAFVGEPPRDR